MKRSLTYLALSAAIAVLAPAGAGAQSDAAAKIEAFRSAHADKITAMRDEVLSLSDAAIAAGINVAIARQNEMLAGLSKSERKKAAKLGDAFWLDCPSYYTAQVIFTEADPAADETARFNARSKKIRAAMMQNAQAALAGEAAYRANGDENAAGVAGRANAEPTNQKLRLAAAASALKCDVARVDMINTDLSFVADLIDAPYRASIDHAKIQMPADALADAVNE